MKNTLFLRIKSSLNQAIERYLYEPNLACKILAICLWPLSLIWALVASFNARSKQQYCSQIAIFSVGNLSAGGNNKSPFVRALAQFLSSDECAKKLGTKAFAPEQICIIMRGYKRQTSELLEVNCIDAQRFGDEASEHKMLLSDSRIVVCKDRLQAIKYAEQSGAKVVILDDAFAKFHIKKFDFLLEPKDIKYLPFCLPAGPLRLPQRYKKLANFTARAKIDYELISQIPKQLNECFFLSTIAKPQRLEHIYSNCAGHLLLPDHSLIDEEMITHLMQQCGAKRLICTGKDAVKLTRLKPEIIALKLVLSQQIKQEIIDYIKERK